MRKMKKKIPKPVIHDQWIEITRKDGKTVTDAIDHAYYVQNYPTFFMCEPSAQQSA